MNDPRRRRWRPFALLALPLLAAACGPKPPTDSFSANLDGACNPYDPYDRLAALIAPRSFWLDAYYDMVGFIKAGEGNLRTSQQFLTENRSGRGQYRALVLQRARELGYSPARTRRMLDDNMAAFERQAVDYKRSIEQQRLELAWASRCRQVAEARLDALGVAAQQRAAAAPGSRKKIEMTYRDLLEIRNLTVEQARRLGAETTLRKADLRRALEAQGVPRDIREEILSAFDDTAGPSR